jgi:hypothetical protein
MSNTEVELRKVNSRLDELARLAAPGSPEAEVLGLTKQLVAEATRANRRAMTVRKELALPQGTIVISPDRGSYGVIGEDGMIDPASVKPLDPHAFDQAGIFYTPSKRPVGSDGSGQSLFGRRLRGWARHGGLGDRRDSRSREAGATRTARRRDLPRRKRRSARNRAGARRGSDGGAVMTTRALRLAADIAETLAPRRPAHERITRLHKLNGTNHTPAAAPNTKRRVRPARRSASAAPTVVLQPTIYVQAPDHKPPTVNVTLPAQKATRTRVVSTDEDGIATETITEPVE